MIELDLAILEIKPSYSRHARLTVDGALPTILEIRTCDLIRR